MGRVRGLSIVVVALTVVGLVFLALAAETASSSIRLKGRNFRKQPPAVRSYDCGSVLSPKDVRNLVSRRASVPAVLTTTYQRCAAKRNLHNDKATRYLIIGAVFMIIVFTIPAIVRGRRRRKHRPRRAYTV